MAGIPAVATARARREHYRENMRAGFNAVVAAYEHTHERYLEAIGGPGARRILDVACGGGALSAWLADRTTGEVVGVDLSDSQLAHARRWLADGKRPKLRFVQHD